MMTEKQRISYEELDEDLAQRNEVYHPVLKLEKQVTRLFEDFYARWDSPLIDADAGELEGFYPRADVSEGPSAIWVAMELPGVREEDLEISITDGELTIAGRKNGPAPGQGRRILARERTFGPFRRVFPLRTEVELDGVRATWDNGLLEVTLPKSRVRQSQTRRVRVQR